MRKIFNAQLQELNNKLRHMGALCETALASSSKALTEHNIKLAHQTIETEAEIDKSERETETLCLQLLLQQQPVATDLRVVSAALKMITDLERIGDQAADISDIVMNIAKYKNYKFNTIDIEKLYGAVINMVTESIDAFVEKDKEKAQNVILSDDEADGLFDKVVIEITDFIRNNDDNNKNNEAAKEAVDFLMIAKYLERIGDHASNVAEWVIFSITGSHPKIANQ